MTKRFAEEGTSNMTVGSPRLVRIRAIGTPSEERYR